MPDTRETLEALYRRYNRRRWVHPDPLETVYRWTAPADQEIAGLLAAVLAYGRVAQILASIGRAMDALGGPSPRAALEAASPRRLAARFASFRHRFTAGAEVAALLAGVKRAVAAHGSLEALFASGISGGDATVLPALESFVDALRGYAGGRDACPSLLSSPRDGSACKRLNLWLRWMARRDAVDPGPWRRVPRAKLVVPLDTHMFRICRGLGLTGRRQADLAAAREITAGLAALCPRDPVRYDFALTRLGINPACRDGDMECLLKEREGTT